MDNKNETVLQLAVEIENRGIKYYHKLKNLFNINSQENKILDLLEKQGIKHKSIYEQMLKTNKKGKIINVSIEVYKVIRTLVEGKIFNLMKEIERIKTPRFNLSNILFDCIQVELDVIYFFKRLARNLIPSQLKLINEIITEENEHIDLLFNLRIQYRIEHKIK